jgi:hypothetical protein
MRSHRGKRQSLSLHLEFLHETLVNAIFKSKCEFAPPHEPTAHEDSRVISQVKDEEVPLLRLKAYKGCSCEAREEIFKEDWGLANRIYPHPAQGLSFKRPGVIL